MFVSGGLRSAPLVGHVVSLTSLGLLIFALTVKVLSKLPSSLTATALWCKHAGLVEVPVYTQRVEYQEKTPAYKWLINRASKKTNVE